MTDVAAYRGGNPLTLAELRSHLAVALKLENVGVLLGAGASKEAGGKLVAEIWKDLLEHSPESITWLAAEKFISKKDADNETQPNVESLLDRLQIAESEWTRQTPPEKDLSKLRLSITDLYRALVRAAILDHTLWEEPASIMGFTGLLAHQRLLSRLTTSRQPGQAAPWIFTTNYDLASEWAAERLGLQIINGFAGLHVRAFAPSNFDLGYRNVQARGEARFGTYHIYLAKLHGSLTWTQAGPFSLREQAASAIWPKLNEFIKGKGVNKPEVMIYPSAAKYVQTATFVVGELIRRFSEFLSRPQTCLIVSGYSFADEHLNRILASALQNPTLHLVLYVPSFDPTKGNLRSGMKGAISRSLLKASVEAENPQITIVGGGQHAFFSEMTKQIPEPALIDEHAEQVERFRKVFEQQTPPISLRSKTSEPPEQESK